MQCLKYYVSLNESGYPILGTQRGYATTQCGCNIALLPTIQMSAPAGKSACHHPNGLRYYYRIDRSGKIMPNSLFVHKGHPGPQQTCILEYIKYC